MSATTIIPPEDQKLVAEAVEKLMEHFDSVRIFVTRHDGSQDATACYERGGGNFYAQLGQVAQWITVQDQYQRNHAIRKDADE